MIKITELEQALSQEQQHVCVLLFRLIINQFIFFLEK